MPQISTVSVCQAQRPASFIPYTSGTSTFYISSCIPSTSWYTPTPSTMWYTQNATTIFANINQPGASCLHPSTVYVSITVPASISTLTTISTVFEYRNGIAPPAQTITQTSFPPGFEYLIGSNGIIIPIASTLDLTTTYSMTGRDLVSLNNIIIHKLITFQ